MIQHEITQRQIDEGWEKGESAASRRLNAEQYGRRIQGKGITEGFMTVNKPFKRKMRQPAPCAKGAKYSDEKMLPLTNNMHILKVKNSNKT